MRRISFLFIIAVLGTISQEWLTIGSFKVHQKEISDKWCIQANVKGNCCKGKCWLTRILDNIHDQESEERVLAELNDQQEFLPTQWEFTLGMNSQHNTGMHYWIPPTDHKSLYEVFHPPRA